MGAPLKKMPLPPAMFLFQQMRRVTGQGVVGVRRHGQIAGQRHVKLRGGHDRVLTITQLLKDEG